LEVPGLDHVDIEEFKKHCSICSFKWIRQCIYTTQRHNPEDLDLKHHRRENLKTRKI
jgi:hypothetical protein